MTNNSERVNTSTRLSTSDKYPHLSYFRKDNGSYRFRIRHDNQYWPAIARLTRARHARLRYAHAAREFRLPATGRSQMLLATTFPVEWEIIANTEAKEITF